MELRSSTPVLGGQEAMRHEFPESDWKTVSELRLVALERFCKRVLDEVSRFPLNTEQSYHQRYLELFRWLGERNDELAKAFDDPRRSQMLWQLAAIYAYGLLKPEEFARFTPHTRERVQLLAREAGWRAAQQGDEADKP
jgi:hypothetical protein